MRVADGGCGDAGCENEVRGERRCGMVWSGREKGYSR